MMKFESKLTDLEAQRFLEKLSQMLLDIGKDSVSTMSCSVGGDLLHPEIHVVCNDPKMLIFRTLSKFPV